MRPVGTASVWDALAGRRPGDVVGLGAWARSRSRLRRALWYVAAASLVGVALWLAQALGAQRGTPSTLFLMAVVVSGWLGGLGPALAATAASFGALGYFFEEPAYAPEVTSLRTSVDGVLFLVAALITSALQGQRRAALKRASVAAEEAAEAVRLRDQVLAMAAHDLRTPLTVLKGSLQLLRRSGAGAGRLEQGLARMEHAVRRMERLMDDLLDAAALQMGRALSLRLGPTDLVAVAERAAGEHAASATLHRIIVQPDVESLTGEWDEARLERVLDNLLSNALKYSPGGGTVRVTLTPEGGPDGWVVVRVHDTGAGIAETDLPHLREAFRRGTNAEGTARGSGVGLVGVYAIVEAHGGEIQIQSRERVGTTVTVRLPRRQGTAKSGSQAREPW